MGTRRGSCCLVSLSILCIAAASDVGATDRVSGEVVSVARDGVQVTVPEGADTLRVGDPGLVVDASGMNLAKLQVSAIRGNRVSARITKGTARGVTIGLRAAFQAAGVPASAQRTARPHPTPAVNPDAMACEALKTSRSAAAFEAYLRRFPDGVCVGFAEVRLAELSDGENAPRARSAQKTRRGEPAAWAEIPDETQPEEDLDLGMEGGIEGGVTGGLGEAPPLIEAVRVGGQIKEPKKLRHVAPVYPAVARQARVQGVVVLEVIISPQGLVTDVRVVRGIPLLDAAAIEAVKQWVYTPTLLNGVAAPVIMTVTVNFRIG